MRDNDEDVRPWVSGRGYRGLKIKLSGRSPAEDAARTADVWRMARSFGADPVRLVVDSNEGNPDAASVAAFLKRLREIEPAAFEALRYLEQPTGRDIRSHSFDWRDVTRLKPVMLDEGLTDLALLPLALEQGWSGIALKTCKGHSFSLAAAAWASEHGLSISVQDLTNPGLAAIHAALLAAHLPTINGVELNSPQFTPAANEPWLPRLSTLLEPRDGCHRLPEHIPPGLGSLL
jgi:L-alanine-DL-glutamate epimerase-like enolase superfamily enzyme